MKFDPNSTRGFDLRREEAFRQKKERRIDETIKTNPLFSQDVAFQFKNKVMPIPIKDLSEFPNHPFKVLDNEDMDNLVESIRTQGVLEPIKVRVIDNDNRKFEIISGHRRCRACKILGYDKIPGLIVDVDEDEAKIMMVDSNSQRSKILPSEKAFAYKMKLEAIKRKAGRPKKEDEKNSCQVGTNFRADLAIAEDSSDSARQIQRYIRLTELIPSLLDLVDRDKIKLNPAVELSYLSKESQEDLFYYIGSFEATPSLAQAKKMKDLDSQGKLTSEIIRDMMSEEKPNQKEKPIFKGTGIDKLLPKEWNNNYRRDFVTKAVSTFKRLPDTVTEQQIVDAYELSELIKMGSDEEILEYVHSFKSNS